MVYMSESQDKYDTMSRSQLQALVRQLKQRSVVLRNHSNQKVRGGASTTKIKQALRLYDSKQEDSGGASKDNSEDEYETASEESEGGDSPDGSDDSTLNETDEEDPEDLEREHNLVAVKKATEACEKIFGERLRAEQIFKNDHYENEEREYQALQKALKDNADKAEINKMYAQEHYAFTKGRTNPFFALKNLYEEIEKQLDIGDVVNVLHPCTGSCADDSTYRFSAALGNWRSARKQLERESEAFNQSFLNLKKDLLKDWIHNVDDANTLIRLTRTISGNNRKDFETALRNQAGWFVEGTYKQRLCDTVKVYKSVADKSLCQEVQPYVSTIEAEFGDQLLMTNHPLRKAEDRFQRVRKRFKDAIEVDGRLSRKALAWRLSYRYLPAYLCERAGDISDQLMADTPRISNMDHILKMIASGRHEDAKHAFIAYVKSPDLNASQDFFEAAAIIVRNASEIAAFELKAIADMFSESDGGGESKDSTEPPYVESFSLPFSSIQIKWIELKKASEERAMASDNVQMESMMDQETDSAIVFDFDVCRTHAALDKIIFDHVGMEDIKRQCLDLYKNRLARCVETKAAQPELPLNFQFLGNPGTGKTTIARLLGEFLFYSGLRPATSPRSLPEPPRGSSGLMKRAARGGLALVTGGPFGWWKAAHEFTSDDSASRAKKEAEYKLELAKLPPPEPFFEEKSAASLLVMEGDEVQALLNDMRTGGGGVLFIDEAYGLDPHHNDEGKKIFDLLMTTAENDRDTITIILAGYKIDIEKSLIAFNPGLARRFPSVFLFEDYSDDEMLEILNGMLKKTKTQDDNSKVSGWEMSEKVARVLIRHISGQRGTHGFGNAGTVRNAVQRAIMNASARVGLGIEDATQVKGRVVKIHIQDVAGNNPKSNVDVKDCLADLQRFHGLKTVKREITSLLKTAYINWQRETACLVPYSIALNRLFVGNPGTGKTSIAKIYGHILKALGYLSDGSVKLTGPSDYIGGVVGESVAKTAAILETAKGKVLIIDEAYALAESEYGLQVLETLVERVSSKPGTDMAVILVGYQDKIMSMCRETNPGLGRRFDADHPIVFEDYDDDALLHILNMKCETENIYCSAKLTLKVVQKIAMQRNQPFFGNAGTVENELSSAKKAALLRTEDARARLELVAADFGLVDQPSTDELLKEVRTTNSCPELTKDLEEKARAIEFYRKNLPDENLPMPGHYVFVGNSGTGKTTSARKLGKIFFNLGILSSDRIIVTSAPDLKGSVVGEAQKLVRKKMEEALGGTLLIDEAYELGQGSYGREAQTQLVAMLEEDKFKRNIVVILAGYEREMREMFEKNQGMRSRFENFFTFEDWSSGTCATSIVDMLPRFFSFNVRDMMDILVPYVSVKKSEGPFANGRGCRHIAKVIRQYVLAQNPPLQDGVVVLSRDLLQQALTTYVRPTRSRSSVARKQIAKPVKKQIAKLVKKQIAKPVKKRIAKPVKKRIVAIRQYNSIMYEF